MPDIDDARTETGELPDFTLALGVLYSSMSDEELEDLLKFLRSYDAGNREEVLRQFRNALVHSGIGDLAAHGSHIRTPFYSWAFDTALAQPMREVARAAGSFGKFMIIKTPNSATTAILNDFVAALNESTEAQRRSVAKLRSALLPESRLAVSPPLLEQVRRNAEAQAELADEFGMLTAAEVHTISGSHAQNTSARASRLRSQGRIFSVDADGLTLFPAFQFDTRGKPREVIAGVVSVFESKLSGWELALWFTSSNAWIGDARPVDLLEDSPIEVVSAAARLAGEILAA